ncbi:MAG: hypothetical protein JTT11_04880 [Candidatus Brockarchaeota archaeon]|nr:hypothetical protein [Candidatus Brockarchaeota archaeon]
MTQMRLGALACLAILLAQAATLPALSQREEPIDVVDVAWGVAPNRISVGPGDKAVPLTVTVQNVGSKVVSGISMRLELDPPFSNMTGGRLASSYIPTAIQPGQSASAQFMLNVADGAETGEYVAPLRIDYLVVEQQTKSESSTTQDSRTSSSTSSSTESSIGKSSTSQTQRSTTSSTQESTSTSSTSFAVESKTSTVEVAIWLPGKTIIEVVSDTKVLTAGQANQFPIVLRNVGSAGANSLRISLYFQPSTLGSSPVVIQGSKGEWYVQDLPAGSNVTLVPEVFASTEAIEKAYQMQVSLNYRDAVGTARSETCSLGFSVQGSIRIVVQSVFISPTPVGSGGNFTISGDILNEGNVAAMYTNATATIAPPFEAIDGSSIYLGELDPNTPLPFSLSFKVVNGTSDGTYPLEISFYYKDAFGGTHRFARSFDVEVMGIVQPPAPPKQETPSLPLPTIAIAAAAAAVIVYALSRRRGRS